MRAWIVLLVVGLVGGCESTTGGGVMDSVMGQVASNASSDVMRRTVGTVAGSSTVMSATQQLCGSDTWGICHNATATMLAGFSDAFVGRMTQQDVEQASGARERSIRDGQPHTWQNPASGASGQVETKPSAPLPPKPTVVSVEQGRVDPQQMPLMDAVGEPYVVVAPKGANVRNGPGTQYTIVESLVTNAPIMAIAKVRDQAWYLAGRGKVGIGYVNATLIAPRPYDAAGAASAAPAVAAPPPPAVAAPVQDVQVSMAAECYTTTQRVTLADGTSEAATVTSCRTPNGWAQV